MEHSSAVAQRKAASRGREPTARRAAVEAAPAHPLLAIQRTAGNEAVQRLLRSTAVQAKLHVSQPGDKLEQEADRAADKVMRAGAPERPVISRMTHEPQRMAAEGAVQRSSRSPLREHPQSSVVSEASRSPLREYPEPSKHFEPSRSSLREHAQCCETVQRAEAEGHAHAMPKAAEGALHPPDGFADRLGASKAGGQPVAPQTRAFFEPRLGSDFSGVRVHTGPEADKLNRDIHAKAFTSGSHIYFAAGNYSPETSSGKTLLAHELTHVVQQGRAEPLHRSTVYRRESGDEPDDKPTPEQRAAALAAAARADKVASAAAAAGNQEIDKSREQESKHKAEEKKAIATKAGHEAAKKKPAAKGHRLRHAEPVAAPPPEAAGAPGAAKKAPKSPQEDPAFQAVVKRVVGVAGTQKKHEPGEKKAGEAQAAAHMPKEERTGRAQDAQAGAIEKTPPGAFDAAALKSQLMKRIAELAPKTLSEADDFKKNNKLAGVKEDVGSQVAQEKAGTAQPIKDKSNEPPNPEKIPEKPVVAIPGPATGAAPSGVGAGGAAPKAKTAEEVEKPIQENTQQIGGQMAGANITEAQLAKSNEPKFQEALASKKSAEADAAGSVPACRASEHQQIAKAEAIAVSSAASKTAAMHTGRGQAFGKVRTAQDVTREKDETARRAVGQHIAGIYTKTKTEVDRILAELDGKVDKTFDQGSQAAKQAFEDYVDAKMTAYKDDRYGGWARWAKDKLLGMPSDVNSFYADGRDLFIKKMDAVLDTVVAIIAADLTAAKAEVAKGRKEISDYLAGLPDNLKKVGAEAAENANSMFDSLEESVNSKAGELVDSLANKYQESLKAIDARIEEMKEANKGLVDKAIDAVKGVIQAIIELKNLFLRVLAKIAQVVSDIIADPIGFLKNLIAAIKLGLENFISRLGTHFKNAFVIWLTGSLGGLKIQLPDDVFSVKGIFSLILQVLGLTWDYVRAKAVKLLGEPVVKALETGFHIFQILIKEGPAGLWEFAKEKFADLKAMVIAKIEEMLIVEVIKAGIKWILGLLNPVAAFIKAAIAIYDIVTFFIEKAKQIMELIEAIIDGIAEVVKGNIGGAAKLVEDALAKVLPIVIGFLASLLNIGGLADKVQALFKALRQRVDAFIDSIIMKAKEFGRKLLAKLSPGKHAEAMPKEEKDKHGQIEAAVVKEMEASPSQEMPYSELKEFKQNRAKSLEAEYGKQLTPPVKLRISFPPADLEQEHDEVDFEVYIGPNARKKKSKAKSRNPIKAAHDKAVAASGRKELLKGHGKSAPGRAGHGFTAREREPVDRIGYATGDHSDTSIKHPGTTSVDPGTWAGKSATWPDNKGRPNWIPDHQPPDTLARTGGAVNLKFRFYPHSLGSAKAQGGVVTGYKNRMIQYRKRPKTWAQGVEAKWFH